jgi:biopolymer transport protein ExbD
MRRRVRRELEAVEFNFAPMVDVVLLLVIFFMLASNLNKPERAFPVNLPQAGSAQVQPQGPLVVGLSQAGRLSLDGTELSSQALEAALREALKRGSRPIVLEADLGTTHGTVVKVISLIRAAGGQNVQIATLAK